MCSPLIFDLLKFTWLGFVGQMVVLSSSISMSSLSLDGFTTLALAWEAVASTVVGKFSTFVSWAPDEGAKDTSALDCSPAISNEKMYLATG
jgi:hypothetical protein